MAGPQPFNQIMFDTVIEEKRNLKIGLISEMPHLPVCPATKRAMLMTKKALEEAGYEVVEVNINEIDYERGRDSIIGMITQFYVKYLDEDFTLSGERLLQGLTLNITLMNAGFFLRFIMESLMKCLGMGRSVKVMRKAKRMDNYELDQMMVDRNNFRKEFSKKW